MVGGSTTMSSNAQNLPLEVEALVGHPGFGDDVDGFLEPRLAFLHRNAEAGEFVVAVALADAEIQPPAGQQVDRRRLLGQQHRIVPRQHDHRRAQPDRRDVFAPIQVSRFSVAETWPNPVK